MLMSAKITGSLLKTVFMMHVAHVIVKVDHRPFHQANWQAMSPLWAASVDTYHCHLLLITTKTNLILLLPHSWQEAESA